MKIPMVALALVLASSVALAQSDTAPHGSPNAGPKQPYVARMKDELGLTDEQVQKMREIRDSGGTREQMQAVLTPEQRAKMAQVKKEHRSARKARVQQELGLSDEQVKQMREIRDSGGTREDMQAVLTPEQRAKFDAMRAKRSPHGPGPGHKAAPASSGATPATPATPAAPAAKPTAEPAS